MSETKQVCYSVNGEEFNFSSMNEVLFELAFEAELTTASVYYESDCIPITHEYIITDNLVCHLLENFDECVYEEVGESYDNNYSDVSTEAIGELRLLILAWAKKHVELRHWRLKGETREKTLTTQEIEEFTK